MKYGLLAHRRKGEIRHGTDRSTARKDVIDIRQARITSRSVRRTSVIRGVNSVGLPQTACGRMNSNTSSQNPIRMRGFAPPEMQGLINLNDALQDTPQSRRCSSMVNLSLLRLRLTKMRPPGQHVRVPIWVPASGLVTCIAMISATHRRMSGLQEARINIGRADAQGDNLNGRLYSINLVKTCSFAPILLTCAAHDIDQTVPLCGIYSEFA